MIEVAYTEQRNDKNELEGYTTNSGRTFIGINSEYVQDVLAWIAGGGVPDPDDTVLAKVKQAKVNEYIKEGVRRIGLQVPEWDTFERIAFVASIWNMLGTPNTAQVAAKEIYIYVKNTAIPSVNVQLDVASVQAIDVVNDVNWP